MNYLQELKKLGQLKKDGKLTEEEFQKKKEEILSQSSKTTKNKSKSKTGQEKESWFSKTMKDSLSDRLDKVGKAVSVLHDGKDEWNKLIRDYKSKKITLTEFRKLSRKLKNTSGTGRLLINNINQYFAEISIQKNNARRIKERRNEETQWKGKQEKSWRKHYGKDVPLLLKKYKGQLFSVPEISKSVQCWGMGPGFINPDAIPVLRNILKELDEKGEILSQKKGNAFYYYVDEDARLDREKREKKEKEKEKERINNLKPSIIKLLKEQGTKIPASDIDAHLKNKNVDEIKEFCEKMYHDGEISRTSNYRYFVLTKKKPKSTQSKQVDIGKELKKYKDLLDQELITQDDYDAKKKELLGL